MHSKSGVDNNSASMDIAVCDMETVYYTHLSAGSQFFIMHKDAPHLDGAYAAFGKVIEGMENVNKIADVRTDYSDRPMKEQKIKAMTVETFGEEYPEPEKC